MNKPEIKTKEPGNTLPEITFAELPQKLRTAAGNVGWDSLMPVQRQAIPYLFAKRDVMMQARTGSGKTGAFLLPMLERINPNRKTCQALILVPTRELARQVEKEAETLCRDSGLQTVAVYGGVGYGPQIKAFEQGAQIVVGTPGRVLDHLLKRSFNLKNLEMLIFDEADRMLSMGFYPDMKQVQRHLPERPVNTCMFSATFPVHVVRAANEFMREPEFISLSSDHVHVTDTEHILYNVPSMEKDRTLIRLIELENPVSAIIFCNTKRRVSYVTTILQRYGYDADELSSDLSQSRRERVLGRVREGTLRFLVATDVAARGIDIAALSHVIQYEPPEDMEAYIHRAGRTGRAGATGIAMTLVYAVEKRAMKHISVRYEIEFDERSVPTDDEVSAVVGERAMVFLEASLRERDKLQTDRSLRFRALAQKLSEGEDELPIITMLLDDYYQKMQHKFVPKIEDKPKRERPPQRKKPGRSRGRRPRQNRR
ncbi:MAG: DEAD/DEAH box helicase [Anaerolineales bacterium]|nr:DEAD/DEAH box helicase [Anaerolineales bacterium]